MTRERAAEFYAEHIGKPFFDNLVTFMSSGPIHALVLARPDAIKMWRSVMGPTNSFVAKKEKPRCLRALYGTDGTQNATHGSDSPVSAAREIKFYFPKLVMEPLLSEQQADEYIQKHLQPTLIKALTDMCKEKPSADPYECITYLGNYLIQHNPNKPRVVPPEQWDAVLEQDDEAAENEFDEAVKRLQTKLKATTVA